MADDPTPCILATDTEPGFPEDGTLLVVLRLALARYHRPDRPYYRQSGRPCQVTFRHINFTLPPMPEPVEGGTLISAWGDSYDPKGDFVLIKEYDDWVVECNAAYSDARMEATINQKIYLDRAEIGSSIHDYAKRIIDACRRYPTFTIVGDDFNGSGELSFPPHSFKAFDMYPDQGVQCIVDLYDAARQQKHEAYLASPEGIAATKRAEEKQKKAAIEQARRRALFVSLFPDEMEGDEDWWSLMSFAPGMEEDFKLGLAKNTDGYGRTIFKYAVFWACLLEQRLKESSELTPKDFDDTSHEADIFGLTGFMHGAAVQILAECWEHGAALKKWHNQKWGRADADGVVNPAIITGA